MNKNKRAGAVLAAISLALVWMKTAGALEVQATDPLHFEHHHHHPAPPDEKEQQPAAEETQIKKINPAAGRDELDQDSSPEMSHDSEAAPDPHEGHHRGHGDSAAGEPSRHDASSMRQETASDGKRDPHAYSGGYRSGPFPPPVMADKEYFAGLIVDRLESVTGSPDAYMTYDLQAWFGKTYDRALFRAEGDITDGSFQNARSELLWAHAANAFWDMHLGVRYDRGVGPDRGWLAFGYQGMAPYWIYVEATAYVNEQGRTAFRIETEYDILLTQKLILQPRIEANFYGMRDPARRLGNGLSDLAAGLRLHYEIKRELAPYIGIEWADKFGNTADFIRMSGQNPEEWRAIAGVQFWF
ncbi:MAG: copper resistance protein B [Gammaproteobacteria bacterium]